MHPSVVLFKGGKLDGQSHHGTARPTTIRVLQEQRDGHWHSTFIYNDDEGDVEFSKTAPTIVEQYIFAPSDNTYVFYAEMVIRT